MPARIFLLFLLVLLPSCAARRAEVVTNSGRSTAGAIVGELRSQRARLATLTGRGELTFESPDRSGSAFFRVSLRRPDSLLVRLQGPFGMEVGSLLLTPSGFLFYNAVENSVRSGDLRDSRFRSLIPVAMEQTELADLFAGQLPLPRDTAALVLSRSPDEITLVEPRKDGPGHTRYTIDADDLTVTKVEILDNAGDVVGEAEALDFREIDGIPLPRRIRAAMGGRDQSLALYFTSQSVNGPSPSFHVTIPSSARRSTR